MQPSQRSRRGGTPPGATPSAGGDRNSPEVGVERPVEASPPVARRAGARETGSLDAVDFHLRRMRALPLATRDDEIACARTAAGARRRKGGGASQCGRCEAGQCRLLEGTLRLVVALAKQHQGMGLSLDDLIQEGNLGLAYALRRFDPNIGHFAAYASPWIRQTIHRAIDQRPLVHAPLRKTVGERRHRETLHVQAAFPGTALDFEPESRLAVPAGAVEQQVFRRRRPTGESDEPFLCQFQLTLPARDQRWQDATARLEGVRADFRHPRRITAAPGAPLSP